MNFRDCAGGLSQIITMLINYSLSIGKGPSAWKIAAVTPVPKINPISLPSDLRPNHCLSFIMLKKYKNGVQIIFQRNLRPAGIACMTSVRPITASHLTTHCMQDHSLINHRRPLDCALHTTCRCMQAAWRIKRFWRDNQMGQLSNISVDRMK